MTKEQAIEFCEQLCGFKRLVPTIRVLRPKIGFGGINSPLTPAAKRDEVIAEWASLFHELFEALDPMHRFTNEDSKAIGVAREIMEYHS